jgi:hypothetical protein
MPTDILNCERSFMAFDLHLQRFSTHYLSVREQCQLGAADQRLYCYLLLLSCDVQELSAPR